MGQRAGLFVTPCGTVDVHSTRQGRARLARVFVFVVVWAHVRARACVCVCVCVCVCAYACVCMCVRVKSRRSARGCVAHSLTT